MTINLTDPANHPANSPLTGERIERVIEVLKRSNDYQNGGDMAYVIADAIKGLEKLLVSEVAASEPVPDEELDQMIWKLERDGMAPKLLSLMRELREVRKAKPYGYVNQVLYEDIGCCGLTNDHEAYADSSTHIPLYRITRTASGVKPAMLNAEKLNQAVSEAERTHPNSFTDAELEMMANGNNPVANAYRELLEFRRNSPVSPDGWVMVPKELTCEMDDAAWGAYHETRSMSDIWEALLAAAPKEVG